MALNLAKLTDLLEEVNDQELDDLKIQVIAALDDDKKLRNLLKQQCRNRGKSHCLSCDNEGDCFILNGIIYLKLNETKKAMKEFENANQHLRSKDEIWNSIIGLILLGMAYEKHGDRHQAHIEYKNALHLLNENYIRIHLDDYEKLDKARSLKDELNAEVTQPIPIHPAAAKPVPPASPNVNTVGGLRAYLSLFSMPIYGIATAGEEGEVYIDPYENTSTILEKVELEGDTFDVFNVGGTALGDRQITLIPQQSYGWLRVSGLSMNRWDIPFDAEDFVLFRKSKTADDNDFVIVSSRDISGEIWLIVKRFDKLNRQFLSKSTDTSQPYAPIPMDDDHKIVGVVISVAKLEETEEDQLNQHQDNIGDLKNDNDRYDELVLLVGGDQATADRLIDYEKIISPNSKRAYCIERAIARLLRDRI